MDVSGVSSNVIDAVTGSAPKAQAGAVKALQAASETQAQTAAKLVESVPEPQGSAAKSDPDSRVGRNVDTHA